MRIITGSARGKRLVTVPGNDLVRPTAERVKEGLFSSIQFDIEGRRVLDLFAGSGQLGLEALSRGAACATFVDSSDISLSTVRTNIESTGFGDVSKAVKSDYLSFTSRCSDVFDLVFIDPPYASGLFEKAVAAVIPITSEHGTVICEHPKNVALPEEINGFFAVRTLKYGTVAVTLYKRGGDAD